MTQYYSRIDATLNGDVYNIPFSYMKESEISVYINDEPITAWEFLNESQIKINEMPSEIPADAIVSIRRTTDITKKVVNYTNQSMLKKENLNLSQNQLLNAIQEVYDNNIQFEIDTENNILQNRTEIDAQIEANKQELLGIQSSFENEVNKTIDTVKEAAEKVNELEQAVEEAKTAAQTATSKADETQEVLTNAVTEMDSRLNSATVTMNEKLSAANTAVENATQQANLATQKAQEIIDFSPANTDLSNITSICAKHFLNKTQITNCILELPERVKIEVNNGTVTAKAGTIAIFPYGTTDLSDTYPIGSTFLDSNLIVEDTQYTDGKFFVWLKIPNDITRTFTGNNHIYIYSKLANNGTLNIAGTHAVWCGPTYVSGTAAFYNTTTNLIEAYIDGTASGEYFSFPMCKISVTDGVVSVENITNGMCDFGNMLIIDKGIKGLAPDGRSADGSLKNLTLTSRYLHVFVGATGHTQKIVTIWGSIGYRNDYYTESETMPDMTGLNYMTWYNPEINYVYLTNNGGESWEQVYTFPAIYYETDTSGKIIDFQAYKPFQAVDNSHLKNYLSKKAEIDLSNCTKPYVTQTYVSGTSGYRLWSDGWCEQWGRVKVHVSGSHSWPNAGDNITTISLLKAFANSNYSVGFTFERYTSTVPGNTDDVIATLNAMATNSVTVQCYDGGQNSYDTYLRWRACGYS